MERRTPQRPPGLSSSSARDPAFTLNPSPTTVASFALKLIRRAFDTNQNDRLDPEEIVKPA